MATNTTRTRYNRDKKDRPKDTLITIEENGRIYFGIARCNIKTDGNPRKAEGRKLAQERATEIKSKENAAGGVFFPNNGFYLDPNGLHGACDAKNVKLLLEYFHNIRTFSAH